MNKNNKIHFIGIAGIGMSSLAEFLHKNYTVTGSDLSGNEITTKLKKTGIKIYENQSAENITNQDLIIYTSAIKNNNPELVEAKKEESSVLQEDELWVNLHVRIIMYA